MMSGGPIEKFTEGWAVKIFGFGKGHYYKRVGVGLAYPVCGGDGVPAAMLRGIGTWKLCQRCEKITGNKTWVNDKAVSDFTRVCDQTGLSEKLRKD